MITRSVARTLMLGAVFVAGILSASAALAADSIKGQVALWSRADCKVNCNLVGSQRRRTQTARSNEVKRRWPLRGSRQGCAWRRRALSRAAGGVPKASKAGSDNPAIVLLAVLGSKPSQQVIVNELTTVASAFTAARFIHGGAISGNALGLRIAAMNVPNLVNLQTGGWGSVIIDGLNLTRSTTLANFNTLASLVTYASTSASNDWRSRFFQAATPSGGTTPSNTLGAMAGIARESWAHPKDLFALFEEAYPQTKEGLPNAAPFVPYLQYAPNDFALILRFSGGGNYAPGRVMLDADSNLWSG